jgi:acetyl-CoA carboxylase biotin carboxyl carrier protein
MASAKGGGSKRAPEIDLAAVRELIRLMDEHRLQEVEIANGASRIRLVRDHARVAGEPGAGPVPAPPAPGSGHAAPAVAHDRGQPIISPMIGTFYRAPSPEAPAFVEIGSIVEKGDTLCVIEAMKMMNEIEAEFRGRVTAVVADNGQTVEYGEELFLIAPL